MYTGHVYVYVCTYQLVHVYVHVYHGIDNSY
jgi:hypothetical protein